MGEIRKENLHESLVNELNELANIDLSGYQEKTDENLVTESKDLVGAINELFQNANNGKQIIADAIGSPLSSDDTFAAMGSSINNMTVDFRNALALKGVNAPTDKFETLISRIDEIVQSGNVLNNQIMTSGTCVVPTVLGLSSGVFNITVPINIGFDPEYFMVYITTIHSTKAENWAAPNACFLTSELTSIRVASYGSSGATPTGVNSTELTMTSFNSSSISFSVSNALVGIPAGTVIKWYAIGSNQLPNNGGEITISPTTTDIVLPYGYYSGNINIAGDSDLLPENIVEGVEIFGVTGTVEKRLKKYLTNDLTGNYYLLKDMSDINGNLVGTYYPNDIIYTFKLSSTDFNLYNEQDSFKVAIRIAGHNSDSSILNTLGIGLYDTTTNECISSKIFSYTSTQTMGIDVDCNLDCTYELRCTPAYPTRYEEGVSMFIRMLNIFVGVNEI